MLLYFAAQGGGRVLWPFLGDCTLGFRLRTLFAIVAAAIVISVAISFVATLSGAMSASRSSSERR